MSTPTALHMASRSCLVKAFFLDASVVADYARCIRMLLTHAAHIRHHRRGNVLERCLAVVEKLLHSLAVLVMETRCTFFPAHVPPGVLWVSSALVFMSMRSVRETLLVLVLLAIICVVSRGLM